MRSRWLTTAAIGVIALWPVGNALLNAPRTQYDSYFGIFSDAVNSFAVIALHPLAIAGLTVLPLVHRLAHRQMVSARLRGDLRTLLLRQVGAGATVAFTAFALYMVVAGVFSFVIAPHLPLFDVQPDPDGLGLTPTEQLRALSGNTTFSHLFVHYGPAAFVAAYAVWTGVIAAVFATFAAASVVWIRNATLAIALPWLFSLAQMMVAALTLGPEFVFVYALIPVGLTPIPLAQLGLLPLAVLLASGLALWTATQRPELAMGLV